MKEFSLEEILRINIPESDKLNAVLINTEQNSARLEVILSAQARILSLLDNSSTEQHHLNVLHHAVENMLAKRLEILIQKY